MVGICHRVNLTRFAYYWTLGAFNIRDPNDNIAIVDELVQNVPIRIYKPMKRSDNRDETAPMPTILFFHGGGFFVGSVDNLEPISYLTAKYTNYMVIYVEYRLIPEHKYPAALDDSYGVTKYLIARSSEYQIDLDNLVLMGDSAGGNLAAVISQSLIYERIARPKMQVLIYPILQFFDFTLPSYQINLPKKVLGNVDHENFLNFIHYLTGIEVDESIFENGHTTSVHKESVYRHYVDKSALPNEFLTHADHKQVLPKNDTSFKYSKLAEILLDRRVSPLLVDDEFLREHTPQFNYLLTAEMDILRDDGFIYANRLRKLDMHIEHRHYKNLFHGIYGLIHGPLKFDIAPDLVKIVSEEIKSIMEKSMNNQHV